MTHIPGVSHTPTPWAANEDGEVFTLHEDFDEIVCSTTGRAIDAAFFSDVPGRSEANSAHIVRCVNAHDALLAACEAALVVVKNAWAEQTEGADLWPLVERLNAAIALAKADR